MGKSAATTRTRTVGAAPAARSWRVWAAAGLLVVAVIAAYGNSFHGPFILDDEDSIVENPAIRHLGSCAGSDDADDRAGPPGPVLLPGNQLCPRRIERRGLPCGQPGHPHPGGAGAAGPGAADAASAGAGGAVRAGLDGTGPGRGAPVGTSSAPDRVGHLHHPAGRGARRAVLPSDVLLFRPRRHLVRGSAWYAAAVAACALGMASKEVMVTAPLVALLYDRIFISGSFKESLRRRWGWYLALAATWAILGLVVVSVPRSRSERPDLAWA